MSQPTATLHLAVEVKHPGPWGGLALMDLEEAHRHARRAQACGMLGYRLQQDPQKALDAETVGEILVDLWIADQGLDADRLLERLGL